MAKELNKPELLVTFRGDLEIQQTSHCVRLYLRVISLSRMLSLLILLEYIYGPNTEGPQFKVYQMGYQAR